MTLNFPPQSTHNKEIETLLTFFQSIIKDHNSVYVSSPITSGRRYIEWIRQHPANSNYSGDKQNPEFIKNVIEKNVRHAEDVVEKMRSVFSGETIIDPTAVPEIKGWKQDDYRYAWGCIIEKYVKILVCSDDWQFSSGCVYEYLIATRKGIKIYDEDQNEITIKAAAELIRDAIRTMEKYNLSTDFQKAVYSGLAKFNPAN